MNSGKLIQIKMDICINVKNAIPKKAIEALITVPVMDVILSNAAPRSNKLVPYSDTGLNQVSLLIGPGSQIRIYDSHSAVIKKTPR